MSISPVVQKKMENSSWIRKMFEEGIKLRKEIGAENVFDFSLGNPDLEPPDEVKKIIQEEACKDSTGLHAYMPNAGYDFCRNAMAEKLSIEQNVKVSGDSIIMSVGAAGALNALLKALVKPGDEVLVSAPYFAEYTQYVDNHGAKLVPVISNDDFSLNLNGFKEKLSKNTAAIIVNSPNNPTGRVYTQDEIEKLSEILYDFSKNNERLPYIIADEPYRDILYDGVTVPAIFPLYENTVIVTSFAKNLSIPGERIGFIGVNPSCKEKSLLVSACIFTTRTLGYVNAPAFFQRVISRAWSCKADYSLYESRKKQLSDNLDNAGIFYAKPQGAFYLFCKVPNKKHTNNIDNLSEDVQFCEHLKHFGILAVPGSGFGFENWIRLAYCVSPDTIKNSRKAFKNAVEDW